MGYTTSFEGEFTVNPPLKEEHRLYLKKFNETRRMKRAPFEAEKLPDPARVAAGLPIGVEGEFFVGGLGFCGQDIDPSVLDRNEPPRTQPSLWCQWEPNEDGTALSIVVGANGYDYVEWIRYLRDNFLKPWGYTLNGTVEWAGEESDDRGRIVIDANVIEIHRPACEWVRTELWG